MRLVDADELLQKIADNTYPVQDGYNSRDYGMFFTGGIEKAICESPTVDAVRVVRCKDCKHGRPYIHTKEYVACEVDCEPIDRDSDFFCADGERRSE